MDKELPFEPLSSQIVEVVQKVKLGASFLKKQLRSIYHQTIFFSYIMTLSKHH